MITKDIKDEINKFSLNADKPILLWLLHKYPYESQWRFVTKCSLEKYGKFSYQYHRIWSPTEEGYVLYKELSNFY